MNFLETESNNLENIELSSVLAAVCHDVCGGDTKNTSSVSKMETTINYCKDIICEYRISSLLILMWCIFIMFYENF